MRALGVIGLVAILIGAGGLVYLRIAQPEKAAIHLLGHWFDVTWEIFVPLLVAGAALWVIALRPKRRK